MKYGIFPGRFQPFHKGHQWVIDYFFKQEKNSHLVIGVVNPDPIDSYKGENNFPRFESWNNPFNYWQRYKMVKDSLKPEYLSRVFIVPMPRPEVNSEKSNRFLPPEEESFFFIPALDEFDMWKLEKYQRTQTKRELRIIYSNDIPKNLRMIRGRYIRALYVCRGNWKYFVPNSTIEVLGDENVYNYVSGQIKYSDAINQIQHLINNYSDIQKVIGHSLEKVVNLKGTKQAFNGKENRAKEIIDYLKSNLRECVHKKPTKEKEIANIIEILLKAKGHGYNREIYSVPFSTKKFIPDFTFEKINTVLEIKLCKTPQKEKAIIDEINGDIRAYSTKYKTLIFLVYDMGIIREISKFQKEIEKSEPNIHVIVIKH